MDAYLATYRSKNREKAREKTALWRIQNPERNKKSKLAHRSRPENREHARLKTQEWRKNNPGKNAELSRNYRLTHPEKVKAKNSNWQKRNPDKVMANIWKRRAQKKKLDCGETKLIAAWTREWKSLLFVSCSYCGIQMTPKKAHVDHVVPLSRGGFHRLSNLCIACGPCNLSKNNKLLSEWKRPT